MVATDSAAAHFASSAHLTSYAALLALAVGDVALQLYCAFLILRVAINIIKEYRYCMFLCTVSLTLKLFAVLSTF